MDENIETNDKSQSSSSDECLICFHKIQPNAPYAYPDGETIYRKSHPECLEEWYSKSNLGLITQKKIKTFSIYQNDILIDTVDILYREQTNLGGDAIIQIDQSLNSSTSTQTTQSYQSNDQIISSHDNSNSRKHCKRVIGYIKILVCLAFVICLCWALWKALS